MELTGRGAAPTLSPPKFDQIPDVSGLDHNEAAKIIAAYIKKKSTGATLDTLLTGGSGPKIKCSRWIDKYYYIPETRMPMVLLPHQRAIIDYAMEGERFQTIVYSTIKKSGKSAVAGAIARYLAENSGHRAEVICAANDREQARSRSYQSIIASIELDPRYDSSKREIPGYWKVIEKHAVHIPSMSVIKAIANDNKGEAGANPVAVLFTEIWGLTSESSKKLWAELTPPPTRPDSKRIVETYAGYEDESEILLDLFNEGMKGRRLTHDDIDWPFPDQPPIWVNERAKIFMYWDSGREARRMPWQQDDSYYRSQAATLPEHEYLRLHENLWVSSKNEFIKEAWWDSCTDLTIPPLDPREPLILGVDGSVNNDSTAMCLVSRHPSKELYDTDVVVRRTKVWYPQLLGGFVNLQDVEDEIRLWCKQYNIVQVAYDQFQLHQAMTNLNDTVWTFSFGQNSPRNVADKALYDMIIRRKIHHDGSHADLNQQIVKNTAMKSSATADERMRIVKKRNDTPVDLPVALSMAAHECIRLNL